MVKNKIRYIRYTINYLIYETKLKTLKQTLKPIYYLLKLNRILTGFLSLFFCCYLYTYVFVWILWNTVITVHRNVKMT